MADDDEKIEALKKLAFIGPKIMEYFDVDVIDGICRKEFRACDYVTISERVIMHDKHFPNTSQENIDETN